MRILFYIIILETTLFFSHFWNENFHVAFEVFSADHDHQLDYGRANWNWMLHEDGFNFYQIKYQENVKQHNWEK